jgi:hypothetical protein
LSWGIPFLAWIEGIERQEAEAVRGYCGIVENDNSGIAGGAAFFSIPELSEARIPQSHRLRSIRQEREMLNLTTAASCRMMEADGR